MIDGWCCYNFIVQTWLKKYRFLFINFSQTSEAFFNGFKGSLWLLFWPVLTGLAPALTGFDPVLPAAAKVGILDLWGVNEARLLPQWGTGENALSWMGWDELLDGRKEDVCLDITLPENIKLNWNLEINQFLNLIKYKLLPKIDVKLIHSAVFPWNRTTYLRLLHNEKYWL